MKSAWDRPQKRIHILYRCLFICLVALVLVLIIGTIYGLFFYSLPLKDEQVKVLQKSGEGQIFTGIGQVRTPTADPQPGMVILFVTFIYYPDDKAFFEELALRTANFRNITESFISSHTIAELRKLGDEDIKSELLSRFNNILRLGQIDTLYFSDFMIIE